LIKKVKTIVIYELWRGIWVIWVHLRDLPGKIITDLVLICIPELIRGGGSAMEEDGCKQGAELRAGLQT
jgi:hypothetical protein